MNKTVKDLNEKITELIARYDAINRDIEACRTAVRLFKAETVKASKPRKAYRFKLVKAVKLKKRKPWSKEAKARHSEMMRLRNAAKNNFEPVLVKL